MHVTKNCTTTIRSTRLSIEVRDGKAWLTRTPNLLTAADLIDASEAFLAAAGVLTGQECPQEPQGRKLPNGFRVGQKIRIEAAEGTVVENALCTRGAPTALNDRYVTYIVTKRSPCSYELGEVDFANPSSVTVIG